MTLNEAVLMVRSSSEDRERVIHFLYNNAGLIQYIQKLNAKKDHFNLLHETIVQFIKTAFNAKMIDRSGELVNYVTAIAKYTYYKEVKNSHEPITHFSDDHLHTKEVYDNTFLTKERNMLLNSILIKLRSNCRAVLMHWANGYSMQEIANLLGYQSEGMARKKKSQCFAELNDFLYQNPYIKEQLR